MAKKIAKEFLLILLTFLLFCTSVASAYSYAIDDTVACMSGGEMPQYPFLSCSVDNARDVDASEKIDYKLFGIIPLKSVSVNKIKTHKLYPGGMPFGIKFMTDGVMVVGFADVRCGAKSVNPASEAGLCINDMIKKVGGTALGSAAELTRIVEESGGKALELVFVRDGKEYTTSLTPAFSDTENKYKTGIYVRDSGAGIGTVTFIDPITYSFGGLGHGVCDATSGELIPMNRGSVVDVTISGVVKGEVGTPGEVKGYFSSGKKGTLLSNTNCGVYGVFGELPSTLPCEPLEVGLRNEICDGKAQIYCTLDTGKIERYDVMISTIDRKATGNKCFTVKVTDKDLLEKTGGIIQGMSGSPIIQNGKLVGAVTHVLINDPTTGYGIFIENMLNQMGDLAG